MWHASRGATAALAAILAAAIALAAATDVTWASLQPRAIALLGSIAIVHASSVAARGPIRAEPFPPFTRR